MPKGFFAASRLTSQQATFPLLPQCGACGLYKTCNSPKMPVTGKGKKQILIVAEAPGKDEDEQNRQLCGRSGQHLEKLLNHHGIDMRRDCWLTNALICRPPGNATPNAKQIGHCRPNLIKTLKELNPVTVLVLGTVAVQSLMPIVWKESDVGSIQRWAGWQIPSQKLNAWIHPTYHPSYVLRAEDPVVDLLFNRHIGRVAHSSSRPWEILPSYKEQVEVYTSAAEAATHIREFTRRGGMCAFDYETNMLKPDRAEAEILSCSICWRGRRTIAYPWHGEAITATKEFLRSPKVRKIASNAKFEERWTLRKLRCRVRSWCWDTMLAAHVLDNRPDITSIKFQSFVRLGQQSYDEHIKKFLANKNANEINWASREIEIMDLLTYNGLDSLLEYMVAREQMEEFSYAVPS